MAQMKITPQAANTLRVEPFLGLNVSTTPTLIADKQSPDMLNVRADETGSLTKRTGYKRIFAESLGEGKVKGMFLFQKSDGTEKFIFAHNGKLYTTDTPITVSLATWDQDDLQETWESEVQ